MAARFCVNRLRKKTACDRHEGVAGWSCGSTHTSQWPRGEVARQGVRGPTRTCVKRATRLPIKCAKTVLYSTRRVKPRFLGTRAIVSESISAHMVAPMHTTTSADTVGTQPALRKVCGKLSMPGPVTLFTVKANEVKAPTVLACAEERRYASEGLCVVSCLCL